MPDVIETFIGEMQERAREKPVLAPHITLIERGMVRLRKAAQESPSDFGRWWRDVEAVISDRTLSVKARLILMGPIGDAMGKVSGGRTDTSVPSSDRVH